MNFNSFNSELFIFKELKKEKPLWIPELYKKLKPLFDIFVKEANEYSLNAKSYGLLDENQKRIFLGYQRFQKKFKTFMDVSLTIITEYSNSIKAYFKYAKYKSISHGCFHSWKKFFTKIIWQKSIVWKEHFNKSTRPKTIHEKYKSLSKDKIRKLYFSYDESDPNNFQNFTTFWGKLINREILADVEDFSSMTQKTLRKILSVDPRYKKEPTKPPKNHPFRNKPKSSGHAQMDLKIFGEKQTGLGRFIASFDCVCTQTRIPFSKIVDPANSKKLNGCIRRSKIVLWISRHQIDIN